MWAEFCAVVCSECRCESVLLFIVQVSSNQWRRLLRTERLMQITRLVTSATVMKWWLCARAVQPRLWLRLRLGWMMQSLEMGSRSARSIRRRSWRAHNTWLGANPPGWRHDSGGRIMGVDCWRHIQRSRLRHRRALSRNEPIERQQILYPSAVRAKLVALWGSRRAIAPTISRRSPGRHL